MIGKLNNLGVREVCMRITFTGRPDFILEEA